MGIKVFGKVGERDCRVFLDGGNCWKLHGPTWMKQRLSRVVGCEHKGRMKSAGAGIFLGYPNLLLRHRLREHNDRERFIMILLREASWF